MTLSKLKVMKAYYTVELIKFIARRRFPNTIVLDKGTVYKSGKPVGRVENRVIWTFNLGGASWWRGFQERFVGMVKHYLKKL